ncbi:MAG: hypothetical protein NC131_06430 [Roseburia sp.]|nr:hypothetical protein [Roseburia sp.]
MYIRQNFVTPEKVKLFREGLAAIGGLIPENKLLILTPKEQEYKVNGIIIPGNEKDMPRKGVIIQTGEITEEYRTYRELVQPGKVVTYGLYAGKEIDFDKEVFPIELRPEFEQQKFTVLSLTEIAYSENNPNK